MSGSALSRLPTIALLLVMVAGAGCRFLSPPPAPEAGVPDLVEVGNRHFEQGDYRGASRAYEEQLALDPTAPGNDQILFRLGLMYLVPEGGMQDEQHARQRFEELVLRFPGSPLRAPAQYLLRLTAEIEELRHRLEELKRIDLGAEGDQPPRR